MLKEKLYELRKSKNISQEEFAEIVNTTRQAVSKWERGEAEPDINKLITISKYYNVSIDYLLDYEINIEDPNEYISKLQNAVDNCIYNIDNEEVKLWVNKYPNNEELLRLSANYLLVTSLEQEKKEELENVIKYLKKLMTIIKTKDDSLYKIESIKHTIAEIYIMLKKFDEAKKYINVNIEENEILYARCCLESGNYKESLDILLENYIKTISITLNNTCLQLSNLINLKKYDETYIMCDWTIGYVESLIESNSILNRYICVCLFVKIVLAKVLNKSFALDLTKLKALINNINDLDTTTNSIKVYFGSKGMLYLPNDQLFEFLEKVFELFDESNNSDIMNLYKRYKETA